MQAKIAVQLYTLREESAKDFFKVLEDVAGLGYDGVEFAGFYNIDAPVLKAKLDALGLKAVASHTPLEQLTNNLEDVIAYNQTIGNTNIVCPYSAFEDKAALMEIIDVLKSALPAIEAAGMTLLYHNHAHEFIELDGRYALEVLFEHIPAMAMELDTYWVHVAGIDPAAYMQTHATRLKLVHLKDRIERAEGPVPAALGTGTIPVAYLAKQADAMGIEWVVVENDYPKDSGIEDVKISMAYLKNLS